MEATIDTIQTVFVEFKGSRRGCFRYVPESENDRLERGDQVIVEAEEGGKDNGFVTFVCPNRERAAQTEQRVIRKFTPSDYAHLIDNQEKEEEAWQICQERIEAHNLDMKLTDVEFKFDRKRIMFYYTADERVDFRQLVRDLAAVYRTRIEMRQIGVRDEAKRHDGIGVCGNRICCSSFIDEFEPVNTQLAKEQGLPLNPSKLTGVCGKLKCCLRYEHEYYEEKIGQFPDVGQQMELSEGSARVTSVDIFNDIVHFWLLDRAEMIQKPLSAIHQQSNSPKEAN